MGKNPAFQYYPKDWRSDAVWGASLAARGLWHEMMDRMHESKQYGYLSANGKPMNDEQIARLCGTTPSEYVSLLAELDGLGVPRRTASGIIFCKRMVEDEKVRSVWRNAKKEQRLKEKDVQALVQGLSPPSPISNLHSSDLKSKALVRKPRTSYDLPGFSLFWQAYPAGRRIDKQKAFSKWLSKVKVDAEWPDVIAGLEKWKLCRQWQDPEFIPHPAKFLNLERWKVEPPKEREAQRGANERNRGATGAIAAIPGKYAGLG